MLWGLHRERFHSKRQSVAPNDYIPLCAGGLSIPLTGEDLDRAGFFAAQFEIISKNGEKRTYPQEGYLKMEVQQSI